MNKYLKSYYSLLPLLIFFTSCNGQNNSQISKSTLNGHNSIIAKGDTVKELGDSLWIIFQDKNNNYWFGSNGQGVYRYNGKTIVHFTMKDGLCNDSVREIQQDKSGNIYFNTVKGISKFVEQTFITLSITSNSNNEWQLQPDDLWFTGAQDSGVVYRYDGNYLHRLEFPKTKSGDEHIAKFPRSKFPNAKFSPYDVYTIFKDSRGNLWFGTCSLGVCRYDGKSFIWISENGLGESPVRSIMEDKHGNFWFGNSGKAVYRYDPEEASGKKLIDFRKEKGIGNIKDNEENFPVSYNSVIKDNNDELWIATYSAGIWRYDPGVTDVKNVIHYSVKDGDKTINLISIYKDNQGDLWLGTLESGVYKFNGKTFERFRL